MVKRYLSLFLISGSVIALDQWTKWLVRTRLSLGEFWLPDGLDWLLPYARITHWYNRGAAFGMFQDGGWLFTIIAVVVSGLIIVYYPAIEPEDWPVQLAFGLQMGGALGNLIDRIHLGHVVDWISVGNFPIFNVADSAITIGVGFLFLGWYWQEKRMRNHVAAAAAEDGSEEALDG